MWWARTTKSLNALEKRTAHRQLAGKTESGRPALPSGTKSQCRTMTELGTGCVPGPSDLGKPLSCAKRNVFTAGSSRSGFPPAATQWRGERSGLPAGSLTVPRPPASRPCLAAVLQVAASSCRLAPRRHSGGLAGGGGASGTRVRTRTKKAEVSHLRSRIPYGPELSCGHLWGRLGNRIGVGNATPRRTGNR